MSQLQVTFQDLYDASSMLQRGSQDIDGQLSTMKSQLSPIHSTWQGAAKGEFDRLWDEWDRNAQALRSNLEGIAQLLNTAGQNYEEAETKNRQSFSG